MAAVSTKLHLVAGAIISAGIGAVVYLLMCPPAAEDDLGTAAEIPTERDDDAGTAGSVSPSDAIIDGRNVDEWRAYFAKRKHRAYLHDVDNWTPERVLRLAKRYSERKKKIQKTDGSGRN